MPNRRYIMVSMVIAGEYKGSSISVGFSSIKFCKGFKRIKLDKSNVESYELITEEHRKSAASGIGRGLVGGALLGPVGMLGGALSAKNKGRYQLAIQFKDGTKSLLEVDDLTYKALVSILF